LTLFKDKISQQKNHSILEGEYENSHYVAVARLILKAFEILLFSALLIFLLVVIGRSLYDAFA
jgi:hypothetical protein